MRARRRLRTFTLVAVVAIVAAACTGGPVSGDKAGGGGEPVVLRLAEAAADSSTDLAVAEFVRRVDQLSGGDVRIQTLPSWGNEEPAAEQQTVRDIAAGKADLGSVGTRVFDTLGINSFQALGAPMLIDSYALEEAVIASDIPSRMLQGLATLEFKVTGLAVFGDGLRKPIAVQRPLLGLADWQGITFASFRSKAQAEAVHALGARPSDVIGRALTVALRDGQVQGAENNILVYQHGSREAVAPYVTANVNLWPKTVSLIANPGRFSKLTAQQQGWLRQAARETAMASTRLFEPEDGLVASVCAAGGRLANASEADLKGLQQAFAPVYASLEQDPETKGFIDELQQLKRTTPAGPGLAIPAGCTGSIRPPLSADPIAGTWTTAKISESQIVRAFVALGGSEREGHSFFISFGTGRRNYAVFTLRFQDGSWELFETGGDDPIHEDDGHYEIGNDGTVSLTSGSCTNTMRYNLSGDTLRLSVTKRCLAENGTPYGSTTLGSFPFKRSG